MNKVFLHIQVQPTTVSNLTGTTVHCVKNDLDISFFICNFKVGFNSDYNSYSIPKLHIVIHS